MNINQNPPTAAESAEILRAVFETAVEGIITITHLGSILGLNRSAERLFGYSEGELIGQNVKMLMPEPYRGEHDQYLRNYISTGQAKIIGIGREAIGKRKDGSEFPIHLGVSEVRVGERRLFAGFIQDLSERKRHESEAAEWTRELERRVEARTAELALANEDLENFCHMISHDLRTPLRGIRSYVDFLFEDVGDSLSGESAEDMAGLRRAANEMELMIAELMEYSRIGRGSIECDEIDTASMVQEIARVAATKADREVVCRPGMPKLRAPYAMVRQIFQNLIENGLHYNKSNPRRVEIWAERVATGGAHWRFYFKDNGIGIDPQYHQRIFTMFQRLHRPEDYEGSGIGLAAVRKAARRLGGDIKVESALGKGSLFAVDLPETFQDPGPERGELR